MHQSESMSDGVRAAAINPVPVVDRRALWSALDAGASPGFALLTLAVLVRALSPTDYGILVIALAASGLSVAINPAIAATTTKFVSELSVERDSGGATIAGAITLSLSAVAVIDLAILLGTAVFGDSISHWLFGSDVAGGAGVTYVLLLAMISVAIQQIDAVLAAAIRGLERFQRQATIEVISRAILAAVVIAVAWFTRSINMILVAQSVVYLASATVRLVALRQLLPNKRLFAATTRAAAGRMLHYGGWMWMTALAGVAYTSVDRIIVGRTLGASAAGQYNVYLQITQLIHFIPASLFAFSLPAFSRLAADGSGGRGETQRTYSLYVRVISWVACGLAAITLLLWPYILSVFGGTGFASDRVGAPMFLILNFLLLAYNVAPYYLLIALGHAKAVSFVTMSAVFAALVLMVVLIPRFGIEGAAVARLAYGVGALALLWNARRLLKLK
jgi:O-antigen/teichoic acid export membrane protein